MWNVNPRCGYTWLAVVKAILIPNCVLISRERERERETYKRGETALKLNQTATSVYTRINFTGMMRPTKIFI